MVILFEILNFRYGRENEKELKTNVVIRETQTILSHYLPGIDENIFRDTQADILIEKEKAFSSYDIVSDAEQQLSVPKLKTGDVESLVKSINELALSAQSELSAKLEKNIVRFNIFLKLNPLFLGHRCFLLLRVL